MPNGTRLDVRDDAVFHAIESVACLDDVAVKRRALCRRQSTDLSCLNPLCCQTRHVCAAHVVVVVAPYTGGADDSIVVAKEVRGRDGCILSTVRAASEVPVSRLLAVVGLHQRRRNEVRVVDLRDGITQCEAAISRKRGAWEI